MHKIAKQVTINAHTKKRNVKKRQRILNFVIKEYSVFSSRGAIFQSVTNTLFYDLLTLLALKIIPAFFERSQNVPLNSQAIHLLLASFRPILSSFQMD